MSRWFRVYDSVLDDPKVQKLDPKLFKNWVNLLCLASRHFGKIPSVRDVAFGMRCTEAEAERVLSRLQDAGLIDNDNGTLTPHKWADRQFQSDNSTERVKRFRQRSKTATETPDETPPETEQIQNRKKEAPSALALEDEFEGFWKVYPKKADRGHALRAFNAARKRGISAEIMTAGAERYRSNPQRKPEYTKNGATWITGECWRDQAAEEPSGSKASPEEREANRLAGYAHLIKMKVSPGLKFTAQDRSKLIQRGLVTAAECEAAGCSA